MLGQGWFHQALLRSFFWRQEIERELDEELRYHIDRATQRNIDRGMPPAEARRVALMAMGGLEQVKEECRDVRRIRFFEEVLQDMRYGWRMMRKTPVFTCIAIAMLALAIGANATVLSLIHSLLVRPLPYPDSHQLVLLWERFAAQRLEGVPFSSVEASELAQTKSFQSLAAFTHTEFNLTGGGGIPERIQGLSVTANLFSVLKANAVAGRIFHANEQNAVVISERLWQRRFASDPAIVGRRLSLNGRPRVVVGIMPAAFKFPLPLFNVRGQFAGSAEVWQPVTLSREEADRGLRIYGIVARLRSGVSAHEANMELEKLSAEWKRRHPAFYSKGGFSLSAYQLQDHLVGHMRVPLFVLQGAVFLLLIIAGANLAAMLLARVGVRQHEMAIRIALGARTRRLVRQRLTEALSLSGLAGGAGLVLSWIALFLLRSFGAQTIPRLSEVGLGKTIVLIMLGLSALSGLLLGLVSPAKESWRCSIADTLKQGGRSVIQARRRTRLRNAFIVAETALALLLLIGAGSLARSFVHLRNVDPGFKSGNILTAEISLPSANYPNERAIAKFFAHAARDFASLPGVTAAAFTSILPLSGSNRDASFTIEGTSFVPPPDEEIRMITPDYFRVLETPLLEGRFFAPADTGDSQPVVIINQALAEHYWPAGNSLGKRISLNGSGDNPKWMTVVGVVANIRHRGLDEPIKPELYLPHSQRPYPSMVLVARSVLAERELVAAIRSQVLSVDPVQPIANVRSLDRVVADSIASRRMTVLLVGMFAGLAILFASTGIYGIMASHVLERRQEIAVQLALGAPARHILFRVALPGTKLLLYGAAIGVTLSLSLSSLWGPWLRNLVIFDIVTVLGALMILSVVYSLAMYGAARLATHEDLVIALRQS